MKSLESQNVWVAEDSLCKTHKQSFSMICMHTSCHSYLQLICCKCKKEKHYQHPNRVLILQDFYHMLLENKLPFFENGLGLSLINIKNKLLYVNAFRIFILQKQSMLMQNAHIIYNTILMFLNQKQFLKRTLLSINSETQNKDPDQLTQSLELLKKYITYNPIQNLIKIYSEKACSLKLQLQKHCSATKTVINDIRQYLVKIVEVLIEEQIQEEDIEYIENEQADEKAFNINIKKPTFLQLNQKEARYSVQSLQELFGNLLKNQVEKHEEQIESDVQKLEEQIKIKQNIVTSIKRHSTSKSARCTNFGEIKQATKSSEKYLDLLSQNIKKSDYQNSFSKKNLDNNFQVKNQKFSRIDEKLIGSPIGSKSPKRKLIPDKNTGTLKNPTHAFQPIRPNQQTPSRHIASGLTKPQQKNSKIYLTEQKKTVDPPNKKLFRHRENPVEKKLFQSSEIKRPNQDPKLCITFLKSDAKLNEQSLPLDQYFPVKLNSQNFKQITNQLLKLQAENKRLHNQLHVKIQRINSLETQRQSLSKINELNSKIKQLESSKFQLYQQNQLFQQIIKQNQIKMQSLSTFYQHHKTNQIKHENKLFSISRKDNLKEITQMHNQIVKLEQIIKEKEFQIKSQEVKSKNQEKKLKKLQMLISEQNQSIFEIKNAKELVQSELKSKQEIISTHQELEREKDSQIQQLNLQFANYKAQTQQSISRLQQKLVMSSNQQQEKNQKFAQLQSKLQEKANNLLVSNKKLLEGQSRHQEVTAKYAQLQNRYAQLQCRYAQLQSSYSQAQSNVQEWQRISYLKYQEEIRLKDSKFFELSAQYRQIQSQLSRLLPQKASLQSKYVLLKSELTQVQEQLAKSQFSQVNSTFQFTQNSDKVEKLRQEHQNFLFQNQRTSEEMEKLQQTFKHQNQANQKIISEIVQQNQNLKQRLEQRLQKDKKLLQFNKINYVSAVKHKELTEWYSIAIKTNQQLKVEIDKIKMQKKFITENFETRIFELKKENLRFKEQLDAATSANQYNRLSKDQTIGFLANNKQSGPDNASLIARYSEMKEIVEKITSDMQTLEQKCKQNTVIEKVYLKELDRKRAQNKKLRHEIENYRTCQLKLAARTESLIDKTNQNLIDKQKIEEKIRSNSTFEDYGIKNSGLRFSLTNIPVNSINIDLFKAKNQIKPTLTNNCTKA